MTGGTAIQRSRIVNRHSIKQKDAMHVCLQRLACKGEKCTGDGQQITEKCDESIWGSGNKNVQ